MQTSTTKPNRKLTQDALLEGLGGSDCEPEAGPTPDVQVAKIADTTEGAAPARIDRGRVTRESDSDDDAARPLFTMNRNDDDVNSQPRPSKTRTMQVSKKAASARAASADSAASASACRAASASAEDSAESGSIVIPSEREKQSISDADIEHIKENLLNQNIDDVELFYAFYNKKGALDSLLTIRHLASLIKPMRETFVLNTTTREGVQVTKLRKEDLITYFIEERQAHLALLRNHPQIQVTKLERVKELFKNKTVPLTKVIAPTRQRMTSVSDTASAVSDGRTRTTQPARNISAPVKPTVGPCDMAFRALLERLIMDPKVPSESLLGVRKLRNDRYTATPVVECPIDIAQMIANAFNEPDIEKDATSIIGLRNEALGLSEA